jgi:threonine synthase
MKYVSTRGQSPAISFGETALAGLAPDGGLYLPEEFPRVDEQFLKSLVGMTYAEVTSAVLSLLDPTSPADQRLELCRAAYTPERFSYGVRGHDSKDILPVFEYAPGKYLAELSNGRSQAFKDFGMALLAPEFSLRARGGENILAATSGDTGSAAILAFEGLDVQVYMLSPQQGMSRYQQWQMWAVDAPNIHNLAIDGDFSWCQDVAVKGLFRETNFRDRYQLMAVNSINWVRIAAQVAYYFWIYTKIQGGNGDPIDVAVPSGNFGDAFAAFYAKMMGLPIRYVIIATNENDVLHRFFETGLYAPRERVITTSPSMDIKGASNLERLVALGEENPERVRRLYQVLQENGRFYIEPSTFAELGIRSVRVNMQDCHAEMQSMHQRYGLVVDPHTATALVAAHLWSDMGEVPVVTLETAQPVKFESTIREVLGIAPSIPARVDYKEAMSARTYEVRLPADINAVRSYIKAHS